MLSYGGTAREPCRVLLPRHSKLTADAFRKCLQVFGIILFMSSDRLCKVCCV